MNTYLRDFMPRVIVIFSHPRYENSRVHRALLEVVAPLPMVTIDDLYEEYADFHIDIHREQERLLAHDVIVWQFPLYVYAPPALLKQWLELVLEFGWAFGKGGGRLKGKLGIITVSTGGSRESYGPEGPHRYPLMAFLRPLERAIALCGMVNLPPFVVQGTYRLSDQELQEEAERYRMLMEALSQPLPVDEISSFLTLNEWIQRRGT